MGLKPNARAQVFSHPQFVSDLLLLFLLKPDLWFVQRFFLLLGYVFLKKDFSCYLLLRFMSQLFNFLGEGGQVYKF